MSDKCNQKSGTSGKGAKLKHTGNKRKSGRKAKSKISASQVTYFKNANSNNPSRKTTIGEALEDIKSGKHKKNIEWVQNAPNKDEYDLRKKTLHAFITAGVFSKRNADSLGEPSGLACLDFDKFKNKKETETFRDNLKAYSYIYAAFVSPSGRGVKALIRIKKVANEAEYKEIYDQLLNAHPTADPACSDLARLCFVSDDPWLWINEKATVFKTAALPRSPKNSTDTENEELEKLNAYIKALGKKDITKTYDDWINVMLGTANSFGEAGREAVHMLSCNYEGYDRKECDDKYDKILKSKKPKRQKTIDSVYDLIWKTLSPIKQRRLVKQYGEHKRSAGPTLPVIHVNSRKSSTILHKEIFEKTLQQVEPIDFHQLIGLSSKQQPSNAQYQIITIEHLLKITQANGWGLCRHLNFTYAFNGCYWSLIEESEMNTFLGKVAGKLSVPWDKAMSYKFQEELYKQFMASATLTGRRGNQAVLIPLQNGTFAIENDKTELRSFDPNDFQRYQLPFSHSPKAKCPLFTKFLNRVLPDRQCQLVLAEFLGWIFTKELKLEKALLLYGPGANGKSVLFDIINALLGGENNVSNFSLSNLTNENGYARAMIANKLLNYASEINGTIEAKIFKALSSGEPVEARLPYGNPMIITDYAKLLFNTNQLPHDVEHTNAFFRRFIIIPFNVTIPEKDQDPQLAQKIIKTELAGIFNWVLSGLKRLLKNKKFTDCRLVQEQLAEFRKQSDTVTMFLEEESYVASIDKTMPLKEIYLEYQMFCNQSGYRAGSVRTMSDRLRNAGFEIEKKNFGRVVFIQKETDPPASVKIIKKETMKNWQNHKRSRSG